MLLPEPEPGLVIHYDYLWRHEREAGREQGAKSRPCAIILSVKTAGELTRVVVVPITHRPPAPPSEGIEIPAAVKRHLGLDTERSWIVVTDLNAFIWPGFDLRPIPNVVPKTFAYGFLPPKFFRRIVARILEIGTLARSSRRD